MATDITQSIFPEQVKRLKEYHYLVLYWATESEGRGVKYNITNAFDDLKAVGLTRTKQTAVAVVESLETLCFIDLRGEQNRKNLYITHFGAQALRALVMSGSYQPKKSTYLESIK